MSANATRTPLHERVNLEQLPQRASEINQKLSQAWNEGNLPGYRQAYSELTSLLGLPLVTNENDPSKFSLASATNGAFLGYRHHTTSEETQPVLQRARLAHQLLSKLPIEFRQGMLKHFKANTFPKVIAAAAVAQTANMGKSITESNAEISGKGAAWFDWAASATVRDYIESYPQKGIMTGYHIRDLKGNPITSPEQIKGSKAVLVTKYPDRPTAAVSSGTIIKGSGISVEQPPTNYTALSFPGLSLPVAVGNASITKLSPRTPDSFAILQEAFLHDAEIYLRERGAELPAEVKQEVNLDKEETRRAILDGLSQTVTSFGWEKYANSFRLVGGMTSGAAVYKSRMESEHISDEDKRNSIYELAGDNPMYVDDLSADELTSLADNHISRVSSNSGMICTRINCAMVKDGETFNRYKELASAKFRDFDAQATQKIGNPHDEKTKQGALINQTEYDILAKYLDETRGLGADVIGGNQVHTDKGGYYVTPALVIWPADKVKAYESIRARSEEVFAPVTNLLPVANHYEAIRITNLSSNNLSSAVCTHDPDVMHDFMSGTKLGSYNINNPKLGSDNSPDGEHIGHYPSCPLPGGNTLSIQFNGPTGGLAHVAHHLNVAQQNPEFSVWVHENDARAFLGKINPALRM